MSLSAYYTENNGKIAFTRQQASDFAKGVAGDFNPIHDIDARRFCVPGDLLFTVALSKIGLSQHMHFTFTDMVVDGIGLTFPLDSGEQLDIHDDNGKQYMCIERSGAHNTNIELAETLSRNYVMFSGQTFPHILIPMWKRENVMVNPSRPLVMYQSMTIDLDSLDINNPVLEDSGDSTLEVDGKRGKVLLKFNIKDGDKIVGRGQKQMIISGLRPYEDDVIQGIVDFYDERKNSY